MCSITPGQWALTLNSVLPFGLRGAPTYTQPPLAFVVVACPGEREGGGVRPYLLACGRVGRGIS